MRQLDANDANIATANSTNHKWNFFNAVEANNALDIWQVSRRLWRLLQELMDNQMHHMSEQKLEEMSNTVMDLHP